MGDREEAQPKVSHTLSYNESRQSTNRNAAQV